MTHAKTPLHKTNGRAHGSPAYSPTARLEAAWYYTFAAASAAAIVAIILSGCAASGALGPDSRAASNASADVQGTLNR